MKKLLLLAVLTIQAPTLFAAAGSGMTLRQQFESIVKSRGATSDGIIRAFAALSRQEQESLQKELVKALISLKDAPSNDSIDLLAGIRHDATWYPLFPAAHPLMQWLRAEGEADKLDLKRQLQAKYGLFDVRTPEEQKRLDDIEERFKAAQQLSLAQEEAQTPAPQVVRRGIPSLRDLALKAAAEYVAQGPIVKLPAPPAESISGGVQKPIVDLQTLPIVSIPEDAPDFIKKLSVPGKPREGRIAYEKTARPVPMANMMAYRGNVGRNISSYSVGDRFISPESDSQLYQDLLEETVSLMAKKEYLRLRKGVTGGLMAYFGLATDTSLSPQEAYNRLPKELKQHFKGVSVQDLIDNDLVPAIQRVYGFVSLNLSKLFINDFTGLGNIAGITDLQELRFFGNPLKEIQPGAFARLINLQYLHLYDNQLREIQPGAFAGLINLRVLSLDKNQLKGVQPGAFAGLTNLQDLNLRRNQLAEIQPGTFTDLANLQELRLGINNLTKIQPGAFTGLINLQYLYLYGNQLREIQPGAFGGLANLEELSLSDNPIPQSDQDRIAQEVRAIAPAASIRF